MYETIKKFLSEGGKCLLIEDGEPIGVVLTMEEYELLKSKSQVTNNKLQTNEINPEAEKSLFSKTDLSSPIPPVISHPIGEAIAKEMDFPEVSANIDEINLADADDVTLEDLGLDELPY